MTQLVAIDTEYYQHEGRLHRPGGTFACLTTNDGRMFDTPAKAKEYLKALSQQKDLTLVMMNAMYDIRQLRNSGLWPKNWMPRVWDVMLVEQALFGGLYQTNSLADLSRRWLKRYVDKAIGSEFSTTTTMTPAMKKYAMLDSKLTMEIALLQMQYVKNEYDNDFMWYWEIDLPAMWAILDMPPIRMNTDAWLKHAYDLNQEAIKTQKRLGFNVKSRPQCVEALKGVGIRVRGALDNDALESFLEAAQLRNNTKQIDLLTAIIEARKGRDAFSRYGQAWVDNHVEGEWVWPSWNVTGAETGRMSCSSPNMQNIPKRGEGSIYRSFFIPSPSHRFLVGDVIQQEPRFSAFLSGDSVLRGELLDGIDLHQKAATLFRLRGRGARARGKAINLGLNYGMSAHGLAARVGISVNEAQDGLRARQRHYQRYYAWQDRQRRSAERVGYVVTTTGRRCWINPYSWQASRNAINSPVQGSAADHTKLALAFAHKKFRQDGWDTFPVVLVVHDEMVMDVPPGQMSTCRKIMEESWKEAGERLMPTLPTEVEMKSGHSWKVD